MKGVETMGDPMATVLLVEHERLVRDVAARRLEEAGYQVLACPGPSAPEYSCLGTRGARCPLEAAADLVVVDTELPGEEFAEAASGVDLLSYYTGAGKAVVVLRAAPELLRLFGDASVSSLKWPPSPDDLTEAVRSVFSDDGTTTTS